MTLPRQNVLWTCGLLVALVLSLLMFPGGSFAQDNSQGRYRPEGRQVGIAAGREFDERIYEVRTYEPGNTPDEFAGAMVFYPLTLSFDPPNGAIAFMPGYPQPPSSYEWWGPAMASLGYTVFILENNDLQATLAARADALVAAVDFIKAESENPDAPINNKIDPDKIAIMGHSLGGGASLAAAAELGDSIKAVVPLTLYCCELGQSFDGDYSNVSAPALIIASAVDEIAPPAQHAKLVYDTVGSDKIYMEFAEGDHAFPSNAGEDKATLSRFVLAFLKANLDGKANLAELVAAPGSDYADKFSTYETSF